jgi:hypothetical protein
MSATPNDDYDSNDDISKSFEACYAAIRERVKNGGPTWRPKLAFTIVDEPDGAVHIRAVLRDRQEMIELVEKLHERIAASEHKEAISDERPADPA